MNTQAVKPRTLKVNVPEVATKVLKLRKANDKKIMTLSSNWLPLFGFHGDARVVEEMIAPGKGYQIRLATPEDEKSKKVYLREYKSRSANPLKKDAKRVEQLVETAGQKIIREAMGEADHAHITFRYGVLTFVPVTSVERKLLQDLSDDDMINTLVAMTGGVDCSVLEQSGFRVDTVVEYRPQEKRDKTDYTEMTALSALVNAAPRVLCNEDIYTLNTHKLAELVGNTPMTVGHFSLQCDDFSNVKNNKQKAQSVVDMSSTLDMFIPMLNIVDALNLPVIVIENVPGFASSAINDVLVLQLKRRGFTVHQDVLLASEHGGYTTRKRMYMVATALNAPFAFPTQEVNATRHAWNDIVLPNWEAIAELDATDNKTMQDALTTGRARIIREGDATAPTLLKAQGQDTKDSVTVERNGRHYRLPVQVQEALNAMPSQFDLTWAPKDKAAQIIGQSICCTLHHKIMEAVKAHIHAAANAVKKGQLALSL